MKLFVDDPETWTDDVGYLLYAIGDFSSTLAGSVVTVISVVAPTFAMFNPSISNTSKIAAGLLGLGGTGGGAAIALQKPGNPKRRMQVATEPSHEGTPEAGEIPEFARGIML